MISGEPFPFGNGAIMERNLPTGLVSTETGWVSNDGRFQVTKCGGRLLLTDNGGAQLVGLLGDHDSAEAETLDEVMKIIGQVLALESVLPKQPQRPPEGS